MLKWGMIIMLLLFPLRITKAQVLMEVPLLLELPNKEELVRAWYDGNVFFIDGRELFESLGFIVQLQDMQLEALDVSHHHKFSCVTQDPCRIRMDEVLGRLGSSLRFDDDRLHLSASSAATTFDVHGLRERKNNWIEVPGPHLFGRTRSVWGGLMANWQLRRDAFGVHPAIRLTGSALFGTVKADMGNGNAWSYQYDRPHGKWLKQVELGRNANGSAGFSATNIPLARQRLQRIRTFRGQSSPYALVQAVISGEVVDQVQADAEGYYELNTPAWYGTTILEVRTRGPGEEHITTELQTLLTPFTLSPYGRMYYHLRIREQEYAVSFRYGIMKRLTLHSALTHTTGTPGLTTGLTLNPVTWMVVEAESQFPAARWLAGVQLWRSSIQITAHLDARHGDFINTSLTAYGSKEYLSMLLRGNHSRGIGEYLHQSVHPEIWLHHPNGLLIQASWGLDRLRRTSTEDTFHHHWRFAAGQSFTQMQLLIFVDQKPRQTIYGLEGSTVFWNQSLAFRVGWDTHQHSTVGSVRFQASSPFGSLFANSSKGEHTQQIQGSVYLGDQLKLAPFQYQSSAAELRIFEDRNGNGKQDSTEGILPHIEAQIHQTGWTRLRTGALYIAQLEPYQRYQVHLIEASIRDPLLYPATGLSFSFTADPGRKKIIHIPMQRLVPVTGKITGLDRTPLRLKIHQDSIKTVDVYRDGGFSMYMRPGDYTLTVIDVLDEHTLAEKRITVETVPVHVIIDMDHDS